MIVTASTGEKPLYFSVEVRDFSAQNSLTPLPYRIFNRARETMSEKQAISLLFRSVDSRLLNRYLKTMPTVL